MHRLGLFQGMARGLLQTRYRSNQQGTEGAVEQVRTALNVRLYASAQCQIELRPHCRVLLS